MAERFGDLSARIHAEIAAGGPAVRPSHHGLSGQPVSYCYRHMIFCGPVCAWCEPAQPGLFDAHQPEDAHG